MLSQNSVTGPPSLVLEFYIRTFNCRKWGRFFLVPFHVCFGTITFFGPFRFGVELCFWTKWHKSGPFYFFLDHSIFLVVVSGVDMVFCARPYTFGPLKKRSPYEMHCLFLPFVRMWKNASPGIYFLFWPIGWEWNPNRLPRGKDKEKLKISGSIRPLYQISNCCYTQRTRRKSNPGHWVPSRVFYH